MRVLGERRENRGVLFERRLKNKERYGIKKEGKEKTFLECSVGRQLGMQE